MLIHWNFKCNVCERVRNCKKNPPSRRNWVCWKFKDCRNKGMPLFEFAHGDVDKLLKQFKLEDKYYGTRP